MTFLEKFLIESGLNAFITTSDIQEIKGKDITVLDLETLDKTLGFYFLTSGYLDMYYPDKKGKNHLVGRIYAKDYQINGLSIYLNYTYDTLNNPLIKFSKQARLARINRDKMIHLLEKSTFLKFIFSKKLKYTERLVQENYYRSIFTFDEYLAYIIFNYSDKGKYSVENYTNFAKFLKCNRTTLYRALDRLIAKGLIEKQEGIIHILSYENLNKLFDHYF